METTGGRKTDLKADSGKLSCLSAAVIPAFNAGDSIGKVIEAVVAHIPAERVVVVDDGSTDNTLETSVSKGVIVLTHDQNRGKGAALKTGFSFCLEREYDPIVTLDADGQHDPDDIPALVDCACERGADIVLGTRKKTAGGMPLRRMFSNAVTSTLVSLLAFKRIRDSQTGFRAHRAHVLRSIDLVTNRYDTESELLIKAGRQGYKIASVPVRTIYGGEDSHISVPRDTLRFASTVFRSFTWWPRSERPKNGGTD